MNRKTRLLIEDLQVTLVKIQSRLENLERLVKKQYSKKNLIRKSYPVCSNSGRLVPTKEVMVARKEGVEPSGLDVCTCESCRPIYKKNIRGLR